MSATTAGAVKAHLETAGTGIAWYRDQAPQDAPLPFGTIQEAVSITRMRMGDTMDQSAEKTVAEQVQVSIWQPFRNADGKPGEDYTLVGRVHRALDGCRLPTAPTRVDGVTVDGVVRIPQVDRRGDTYDPANGANVVQHALTITIRRTL